LTQSPQRQCLAHQSPQCKPLLPLNSWIHFLQWPQTNYSFPALLEVWNIFLAIMVDHNPAKASQLIAYQAIITSASRQYPLHAWLNCDTHFRIREGSDHTLKWDKCHSDLWFKCITNPFATATRLGQFPCMHCGQTSHYPENCPFRPSSTQSFSQPPVNRGTTINNNTETPVCKTLITLDSFEHPASTCTSVTIGEVNTLVHRTCPNKGGMH